MSESTIDSANADSRPEPGRRRSASICTLGILEDSPPALSEGRLKAIWRLGPFFIRLDKISRQVRLRAHLADLEAPSRAGGEAGQNMSSPSVHAPRAVPSSKLTSARRPHPS
jgi:hypothetical protein